MWGSGVVSAAGKTAQFVGVDDDAACLRDGQRCRRAGTSDGRGGDCSRAAAGWINREDGGVVRTAIGHRQQDRLARREGGSGCRGRRKGEGLRGWPRESRNGWWSFAPPCW